MRIHNQEFEESDGSISSILLSIEPAELVHIEAGLKLLAVKRKQRLGNGLTQKLIHYIKNYIEHSGINRGYLQNLET